MGFWTSMAAAGATAGAQIMSGLAAKDEQDAAAEQHRWNAAGFLREARAMQEATRFNQVRSAQAGERAVGSVIARAGGSGALVSEGAPLHAIAAQLAENEIQTTLVGQQGRAEVSKLYGAAASELTDSRFARTRGRNLRTAGFYRAGGGLLANASTMYANDMFPTSGSGGGSSQWTEWQGGARWRRPTPRRTPIGA